IVVNSIALARRLRTIWDTAVPSVVNVSPSARDETWTSSFSPFRQTRIVTKRRPDRRNGAGDGAHQEDHLLPMAAAGRDHETWSGRLASIGEAEPLAAPFDVTGHRTRCIRMA